MLYIEIKKVSGDHQLYDKVYYVYILRTLAYPGG